MIRLILVRHGNTFAADETPVQIGLKTDLPLTAQGKTQAAQLAAHFIREKILPKAIFSGFLKRQIETAAILSEQLHAPLRTQQVALNEIDYGLWEGKTAKQISAQWEIDYEAWQKGAKWPSHVFGGSESSHLEAIRQWLDHLIHGYAEGDTVMAVASQGILRMFHPQREQDLKVKTGNYCELLVSKDSLIVKGWNLAEPFH